MGAQPRRIGVVPLPFHRVVTLVSFVCRTGVALVSFVLLRGGFFSSEEGLTPFTAVSRRAAVQGRAAAGQRWVGSGGRVQPLGGKLAAKGSRFATGSARRRNAKPHCSGLPPTRARAARERLSSRAALRRLRCRCASRCRSRRARVGLAVAQGTCAARSSRRLRSLASLSCRKASCGLPGGSLRPRGSWVAAPAPFPRRTCQWRAVVARCASRGLW